MVIVLVNIIWALFFLLVIVVITLGILLYTEDNDIIKNWCDAKIHVSDNKRQIELRRLEILEKTPELRNLIFHPKTLEKEEK